jgi:hypothetical protein
MLLDIISLNGLCSSLDILHGLLLGPEKNVIKQ